MEPVAVGLLAGGGGTVAGMLAKMLYDVLTGKSGNNGALLSVAANTAKLVEVSIRAEERAVSMLAVLKETRENLAAHAQEMRNMDDRFEARMERVLQKRSV